VQIITNSWAFPEKSKKYQKFCQFLVNIFSMSAHHLFSFVVCIKPLDACYKNKMVEILCGKNKMATFFVDS